MDEWGPKVVDLKAYKKQLLRNSGKDERPPEELGIVEHLFKRPHNMFLNIGVRMGLVGLLFFLYLWFVAGKMCWKTMRHGKDAFLKGWGHCVTAAFVMFLVKGSLDPIFTHLTEVPLFTILAMITVVWSLNEKEQNGFYEGLGARANFKTPSLRPTAEIGKREPLRPTSISATSILCESGLKKPASSP